MEIGLLVVVFILFFRQAHNKGRNSRYIGVIDGTRPACGCFNIVFSSGTQQSSKTFTVKKMYWMELHVVVFILVLTESASNVYWTVSNKPVIYGDNIILTCKTGHVLTDIGDACQVRQWYGGKNILLYNNASVDVTKYEDRTNISSTEFSLVIKNYTESDLNINYTCLCGFTYYTKLLSLNDEDFIVPALRVDTNIQQSNETLSIYIHVERVYPRLECAVVIEDRTVFHKLTFTNLNHGEFYYGTFEASFNIVDDDCGKKPALVCYIGNEYSIVNTSGEPIQNCTVRHTGSTRGCIGISTETYTTDVLSVLFGVSLFLLVCLSTRKLILYLWKRRYCLKRRENMSMKADDSIDSDDDQSQPEYEMVP